MDKALNRKLSRIVSALLCIALALGVFTAVGSSVLFARADDDDTGYTPFVMEEMTLSNNQFSSSTGSFPKTPDSWTSAGVAGSGSGSVVSGVMDLDTYAANKDSYKLSTDYAEEFAGGSPESPFGPDGRYPGTDRNVLFINVRPSSSADTHSSGTAYGYTSNALTLTANHYYRIEAWTRTGNFATGSGAAIRLNGLDDDVVFHNINTVSSLSSLNAKNEYGWQKFTFYIAASSYADQSISIGLQVGDRYEDDKDGYYYPATGYAFFDNIRAYQISPADFLESQKLHAEAEGATVGDHKIQSGNTIVVDYSNKTSEQFSTVPNLDFTKELNGWQYTTAGNTDLASVRIATYNGYASFDKEHYLHFNADPASSYGKYDDDSDVLVISSYTHGAFQTVAAGVSSEKFTLQRYHHYRISAWAKSQEVTSGSGATLGLSVIRNEEDAEYEGDNLFATITNCEGDTADKARAGFRQYSFYVKGSSIKDYEASVECWLGQGDSEDNKSAGIAIFDNLTIEEITPETYSANSGNGTVVDLDTEGGFITFPETGVSNGGFYLADSYDEFGYPLKPSGWTMYTPDNVGSSAGYSIDMDYVETEDIISGLIPTDEETYRKYASEYFGEGVRNPREGDGSVLMMYSKSKTAFCYRSSDFTVSADTPGALTVSLWADNLDGYGANLVLKKDNATVLATIENIRNTNGFKTYTFYIEPNTEDISTLSVEIWLGYVDRASNRTKLSSGHLYVQRVAYSALAEGENFSTYKNEYDAARTAGNSQIAQAAYSFKTIDFSAYDYYDTAYVKYPYDWQLAVNAGESNTVRYGIFDPKSRPANDSSIPSSFRNGDADGTVLVLHNALPAAATLTYTGSLAFAADTYYKVDVSLKVAIPEQESADAVGATVSLTGTKFAFKDIRTTAKTSGSDVIDSEAFRTYTFYIKAGSEASTASLAVSLGDANMHSKWCSGYVYVNSISYTDITNVAYETAETEIAKRDKNKDYDTTYQNALLADLSVAGDDSDSDDSSSSSGDSTMSWWLIPSILFAVAILIALIGFMIRRILEKRAAKKGPATKQASYDRTATLNVDHNAKSDDAEKVSDVAENTATDAQYDAFDDDAQTEKATEKSKEAAAPTSAEETIPAEEPTADAPAESETTATAEESATATSETTAQSDAESAEKEEKQEQKSDSFLDQFDD